MIRALAISLLLCGLCSAQEPDRSQVAVLGYHDFSDSRPETEMRIRTAKFRDQMQMIKDAGLPVISMEQFVDWKLNGAPLPPRSVLITIDDGWKSVYTDAYPVLKEFEFPFTLFLYKSYVDGGGRALTSEMIREMQENGATIGSHSYTHPFPSTIRRHQEKGAEHFEKYLRTEMLEPKTFLEEKFSQPISTYAYPGGFYTEEMFGLGDEFGYELMFTVVPGKVRQDSANHILNRYIILGTHAPRFDQAISFVGAVTTESLVGVSQRDLEFPVSPSPGQVIEDRLPEISADLSGISNLDPDSISLTVAGFGEVPHSWNADERKLSWQVKRPLRSPACECVLKFRAGGEQKTERWTFVVDLEAAYIPR